MFALKGRQESEKQYDYVDSVVAGLRLKKCVFLHTQKTAGSTVQSTARHIFGNEQVWSHSDCYGRSMAEAEKAGFLSGHFGSAYARHFSSRRYYFTFLRDPIDRILSFYDYMRSSEVEGANELRSLAQNLPLAAFLERLMHSDDHIYVDNVQAWQLAHGWVPEPLHSDYRDQRNVPKEQIYREAIANIAKMDFVGLTDSASQDAKFIFEAIGWRSPEVLESNRSNRTLAERKLSKPELDLLWRLTDIDRRVYRYVLEARHGFFAASQWACLNYFRAA
jgi:hypothetical protein